MLAIISALTFLYLFVTGCMCLYATDGSARCALFFGVAAMLGCIGFAGSLVFLS